MPTRHNVHWEPLPVPQGLTDEQEVFVMRATGEIILTYEEYISRLHWYMDKNWICNRTGRSGLTFEQAQESESTAEQIVSYFPSHLIECVLQIIQGNNLKLDQLIHHIFNLLTENGRAKLFISSYKVTFCKDVIRQFVRDNTYKKVSIPGSPHIVKMDIAEKHNLKLIEKYVPKKIRIKAFSNETPDQLIRRKEFERFNQTLFTVNVGDLNNIIKTLHNCSHQSESIDSPSFAITDNVSNETPHLIIRCLDCGYSHNLACVKRVELLEYPKPDEQLTIWERSNETLKPNGTRDPIFSCCFGDILFAWNFINTMHEFIQLSTFTFRDLEEALLWERDFPDESPSVLLLETFTVLIRFLIRHSTGRINGIFRVSFGGYKSVNKSNWEISVRTYVKACIQILSEMRGRNKEVIPFEVPADLEMYVSDRATLEECSYKRLKISTKAKLLMFICDHIGMSHNLKIFLDKFATELHDTRSKIWEERTKLLEENKESVSENGTEIEIINPPKKPDEINGKTDEIDRNIKRLNIKARTIQLKLKSFSIESIGKDRDYNTYWYIPAIGYRIFIETNTGWIYLDTKFEIEQLIGYLNEKGEKECLLKERIIKLREEIISSIDGYFQSLLLSTETRRNTRMSAMVKHKQSFMSYVNSYPKDAT